MWDCHLTGGNQAWEYDEVSHQIIRGGTNECVELSGKTLTLADCNSSSKLQEWKFTKIV
jgi:hypothetical protein